MKLLIPFALSLALSAGPAREAMPSSWLSTPQAQAEAPAFDQTLARELHFAAGHSNMSPEESGGLDEFLQHADKRIRELKVLLWLPPDANTEEVELAQARLRYMAWLLRAHKIPYEILTLESPYYEDSQGSILAVLEP